MSSRRIETITLILMYLSCNIIIYALSDLFNIYKLRKVIGYSPSIIDSFFKDFISPEIILFFQIVFLLVFLGLLFLIWLRFPKFLSFLGRKRILLISFLVSLVLLILVAQLHRFYLMSDVKAIPQSISPGKGDW